jgi:ribonuclease VapC
VIILDTPAVVAFLRNEPGGEVAVRHLPEGCLSTVTVAETIGRMERDGMTPAATMGHLRKTGIAVVAFDEAQSEVAGKLIEPGRRWRISLGDCCCIALAIVQGCAVLTADRNWRNLNLPIEVRLIR